MRKKASYEQVATNEQVAEEADGPDPANTDVDVRYTNELTGATGTRVNKSNNQWVYLVVFAICCIGVVSIIAAVLGIMYRDTPTKNINLEPTNIPTMEPTFVALPKNISTPTIIPILNPSSSPHYSSTETPSKFITPSPNISPETQTTIDPSIQSTSVQPTISTTSQPTSIHTTIEQTEISTTKSTVSITPTTSTTSVPSSPLTPSPSITVSTSTTSGPFTTSDPSTTPTSTPNPSITPDPSTSNPSTTSDPSTIPTTTPNPSTTAVPSTTSDPSTPDPSTTPNPTTSDQSTTPGPSTTSDPSTTPNPSTPGPSTTSGPSTTPTPTAFPTAFPTASPALMILQIGNTIQHNGFELIFPENAFPDSEIYIVISDVDQTMKELYDESTIAQNAMSMTHFFRNDYTFIVENDPLSTPNISYIFKMPIPSSLLEECGDNYGYEIFTYAEQLEFGDVMYPIVILIESEYNDTEKSLTAQFYPEIWLNKTANFIISCTPGKNFIASNRRILRRLTSSQTVGDCKVPNPIQSPLETERIVLKKFSRNHVGVGYAVDHQNILAVANGTVLKSGNSQFYGHRIILRHNDGSATIYKHIDSCLVEQDEVVKAGDIIANSHNRSHFHLEYIPNGEKWGIKARIDPDACMAMDMIIDISSTTPMPLSSVDGTQTTTSDYISTTDDGKTTDDGSGTTEYTKEPTLRPTLSPTMKRNDYTKVPTSGWVSSSDGTRDDYRYQKKWKRKKRKKGWNRGWNKKNKKGWNYNNNNNGPWNNKNNKNKNNKNGNNKRWHNNNNDNNKYSRSWSASRDNNKNKNKKNKNKRWSDSD